MLLPEPIIPSVLLPDPMMPVEVARAGDSVAARTDDSVGALARPDDAGRGRA